MIETKMWVEYMLDQSRAPLFETLLAHVKQHPISFHVPGHKNGEVFAQNAKHLFSNLLTFDLTELPGLDDLHQPEGAILEAEQLAAGLYQSDYTFFLVNGSTVGNLASILSVCSPDNTVIVQRNSHKSIMNGLELAGVRPVFVSPSFDDRTSRFSKIDKNTFINAIRSYPQAKAVVLTNPDYFGTTYELTEIINEAHEQDIPVIVDEAHGAHFRLGKKFPTSALELGADAVVHSAHKTLPAMTMGSYLHIQGPRMTNQKVRHYLQILQSSSPSYIIMASLDLARQYVANLSEQDFSKIISQAEFLRKKLNVLPNINVQPVKEGVDDPLKITMTSKMLDMKKIESQLHRLKVFPEMVQNNQLLLMMGLQSDFPSYDWVDELGEFLKTADNSLLKHDTITNKDVLMESVHVFDYSYQQLSYFSVKWVPWDEAIGKIAAESVIPYPPGVPVLIKGERINTEQVGVIKLAQKHHQSIQYQGKDLSLGIEIFTE